jgi:plasmid stability protein
MSRPWLLVVGKSPYFHIHDMESHMKTTLNIDDAVMTKLKREAARQGRTMSEMVETALRLMLHEKKKRVPLPRLPTFSSSMLVDISDRDALYRAMEEKDALYGSMEEK